MKDQFYEDCKAFVLSKYPDMIEDYYIRGLELLFFANHKMEDEMIPYSCHKDKSGRFIIETDF